jgi:DNA-binding response OmpR family regulator
MDQQIKILVVEDDKTIASGLEYSLTQEHYLVDIAYTVSEALEKIKQTKFDLYLLDLTLPDGIGYDICKTVKRQQEAPVIFLTAVEEEVNVVMGLDMGADDYITKPFRLRELMSRIKSVLRRYGSNKELEQVITIDTIEIHILEAKVYKNKQDVVLTAMEYRLLLTLVQHMGQVLTRNQLLEGIWDVSGEFVNDNTLTVYMKRLREKLEDDVTQPVLLKTVRGLGYMLEKTVSEKR